MKIGFVSDIHEDIESLRKAFTKLEKMNCDAVICLGDIVGFSFPYQRRRDGRNANACVAMLSDQCDVIVAGNHDLHAVQRVPEFTAGIHYPDNWYELDYEKRVRLSRNRLWLYDDGELPRALNTRSEEILHSLPEYSVRAFNGIRMLFSHFNYPNISGSRIDVPKNAKDVRKHFQFMADADCMLAFSGHGHPEGFVHTDRNAMTFRSFSSMQLDRTSQWIICPSVANSLRLNGILLFDTSTFQLDVLPLCSRATIA